MPDRERAGRPEATADEAWAAADHWQRKAREHGARVVELQNEVTMLNADILMGRREATAPDDEAWTAATRYQLLARRLSGQVRDQAVRIARLESEREMERRHPLMSVPDPAGDPDPFGESPGSRVAGFLHMLLAGHALDEGKDGIDELDGSTVVLSFAGNGASDALTVDDVRAFLAGGRGMSDGERVPPIPIAAGIRPSPPSAPERYVAGQHRMGRSVEDIAEEMGWPAEATGRAIERWREREDRLANDISDRKASK